MEINVVQEIRELYPGMSKSNKLIADCIFKDYNQFINLTAQEIGELSNTSSASVIRFSQKLGFDGLESLKRQLMFENYKKEIVIDPIIERADSYKIIKDKLNTLVGNSVSDLFYQLNDDSMQASIKHLRNANRIYIFGIGASSLSAYDIYHKLNRINKLAFFDFDSHMTTEFINYADEGDVILIFSYSGNSNEAIYPAEIGQKNNTKVISVTSNNESLLAANSDIVLKLPDTEGVVRTGAITSKINSLIVADLLYLGLISPELDEIEKGILETSKLTAKFKTKYR